jgi:hypothetical protein
MGYATIKLFWAFIVLAVFSYEAASATDDSDDKKSQGRILAEKVYHRPDGKDASSRVIMRLESEDGTVRERLLYSYAKQESEFERWSLLRFVEPENIAGTGLLTLDDKGDESDQWLYLPALDRARRISSSRKGGRFVGSDFFYEDLQDREPDMDNHRILGKGKIGGTEAIVLESIPVDPDNSVYSRRVSWIHPGLLLPLRTNLYIGGREKPDKVLQARKIKKVQGYWTIYESTMYNLADKSKSQLLITDIEYDQGLPDSLFTRRGLNDDSLEKGYRP